MSKPMTRVVLSVLLSLAVIVGIYTSVQAGQDNKPSAGNASAHVVNGAMTNLNHDRFTAEEQADYKAQLESLNGGQNKGGGCESELQAHPDD